MPEAAATPGPPCILVAADDEAGARSVAAHLAAEFASAVRTSIAAERFRDEVDALRPQVVVLASATLEAAKQRAAELPPAGTPGRPFTIALCDTPSLGDAARLCRQGVFDDYVQAYPAPADTERLATSVRVAFRAAKAPSPKRRPIVLIVEDDEVLHQLVAAMLAGEDLELVFETEGARATERIRQVAPDLVLMDINLPGGDGVDITQRLKTEPDLAAIPVVMVTGEARRETLLRSLGAGAADFLVKPFTREALIAKLSKYLPAPT